MASLLLPAILALPLAVNGLPTVLVTGTTGRTGAAAYKQLKADSGFKVRAFVRNATKAKDVLECDKCDESEGIFVGNLDDPKSVDNAMKGVDQLVIVTAAVAHCHGTVPIPPFGSCSYPEGGFPKDIDWEGTKTQIRAFAAQGNVSAKHVAYVSSGGTTTPNSFFDKIGNGHISFYKLNAEAFIMGSGLPFTVVKPCGLGEGPAGKKKLIVGHDDSINLAIDHTIQRADVARVLVESLRSPSMSSGLRFDLCSHWHGAATTDVVTDVFKAAMYPWDGRLKAERQIIV
mmetsp:Transcript_16565/g.28980  ORF Transcript_16565/g.28980 Transcript_16565/m.28980 type:complete len:287 (+) Transcript_16565:53-913(+)|eukprot:CAMPEP_0197633384 /NCGR_PEP_ID=MMETSP1338-20131121/9760_1 /TAXON_ID=43686 ORGANISM="Pelagodinium beii, Strain RCC1491" /NCGR_SAMPLE_ID=MMETSP1338 /ASSEMBLY_ACC=CAM_ASM_000754 /LENGTH=286 /DNA_ID=CAMNT_0043205037 /DNA_START=53 /DNA_END=913 /DNA_ORIENTATION=-